jgi:hypothetical protein
MASCVSGLSTLNIEEPVTVPDISGKNPVYFFAAFYTVKDDLVFCSYFTPDTVISRADAVIVIIPSHLPNGSPDPED